MYLLKLVENKNKIEKEINFNSGDIITVFFFSKLNKNKIQNFTGIVIYIKKRGLNSSFLLKKISKNIIIEKKFNFFSPLIKSINIKYKNKFKKSKLYYLKEIKNKSFN